MISVVKPPFQLNKQSVANVPITSTPPPKYLAKAVVAQRNGPLVYVNFGNFLCKLYSSLLPSRSHPTVISAVLIIYLFICSCRSGLFTTHYQNDMCSHLIL